MIDLTVFLLLVSAVLCFWVIVLTFLYISSVGHYKSLTKGISGESLSRVLDRHFSQARQVEEELNVLKRDVAAMRDLDAYHVQRVGFIRFNPFDETGGNQSFALALLDERGDGVVVSSLHSRETTRLYGKPVKGWSADSFELSKEEEEAVRLAREGKR